VHRAIVMVDRGGVLTDQKALLRQLYKSRRSTYDETPIIPDDGKVPSLFSQISSISVLSPGVSNTDNTARSCESVAFEGLAEDDST
jgi:hypothetical protein